MEFQHVGGAARYESDVANLSMSIQKRQYDGKQESFDKHTGRAKNCFTYTVSKSGRGGHHYEGESIPGWGNEIWIITSSGKCDRSISRSTVELGFRKYLEKDITGPRQLGVFGASYLLSLFQRFV